uniref:Uncharacterized protein n=1 Tax=virus sp. ctx9V1 TaxID=2828001 RepID=A0A8S5RDG7_9VIRU|nr:MAG TPA: hypothetical protein [virus sp. ctx9V1]
MLYVVYNRVICEVKLLTKHSLFESNTNRS